jgi:GAF domain-containing protein
MPAETSTGTSPTVLELQRQVAELSDRLRAQREEYDEALQREAVVSEILQVINAPGSDLAPVFDAVLEKAMRMCNAAFGSLYTYDGTRYRSAAQRGVPSAYAAFRAATPPTGTAGGEATLILRTKRTVHILDVMEEEPYKSGHPNIRAMVDLGGTRTVLAVPLLRDNNVEGYISIYRQEVRAFSPRQISLLENFATQAVIAMENARLFTQLRESLEQQTATTEVLQVINSSPGDLVPVFDAILGKAHALCEAAHGALITRDGELFQAVALHGLDGPFADLIRQPYSPSAADAGQRLLHGERLVHVPDLAAADITNPRARASIEAGFRTLLMVPLRKDDELLGYITALRRVPRAFDDKEIALLENFAAQAVIAMENARLLDELRRRTEEVADLNRSLEARVAAQVDELGRIGRLKRFLAPQLAELIVPQGDESVLQAHRRDIVVVFCDLRGYTAFTETAEPEEVLDFLREYHGALGPLVSQFEGTLDQFSGDGIMVFFNDPVPIAEPAKRGWDGGGDSRGGWRVDRRLAPARPRTGLWCRHRPRLCDPRPDRLCRALRLYGHWYGHQCCCSPVQRGQGRADSGEPASRDSR